MSENLSQHQDPAKSIRQGFFATPATSDSVYFGTVHDQFTHQYHQHDSFSYLSAPEQPEDDTISEASTGCSHDDEPIGDTQEWAGQDYNTVAEQLYLQYRTAKRRFRRFTGQPRRRRFFRRGGKGHGKGKGRSGRFHSGGHFGGKGFGFGSGKSRHHYFSDSHDDGGVVVDTCKQCEYPVPPELMSSIDHVQEVFFQKKGSGKGARRGGNPMGRDGTQLTCSICGSTEHFRAVCPKRTTSGKGSGNSTFHAAPHVAPVAPVSSETSWSSQIPSSSASTSYAPWYFAGNTGEKPEQWSSTVRITEITVEGEIVQHPNEEDESTFDFSDIWKRRKTSGAEPALEPAGATYGPQPFTEAQALVPLSFPQVPMELEQHHEIGRTALMTQSQLADVVRSTDPARPKYMVFMWQPVNFYHTNVRLKDRESLLVDVGAIGNLCGSKWASRVEAAGAKAGQGSQWDKLQKAVELEGVGQNSSSGHSTVKLPIKLENGDQGEFQSLVVDGDLPALLGLDTLQRHRAILCLETLRLIFPGQGGYKLSLSPGSKVHKLHKAPTGHLMLPCSEWTGSTAQSSSKVSF